jgi:hypothetical protein
MKRSLAILSTLILLAASAATASAQINARIKGSVSDPTGAALPNVAVTAMNQATGVKYNTTSNASGEYLFPQLPIGTYTISAAAPAFKGFSASGIELNIDQEYVEPIKLAIGNASEQVQVEADSVQVNTTDMQISNIVNAAQMEELPLIGRNFAALELTLPGVQFPDTRFGGTYSVSGAQAQQSEYLINGADTNDIALNTIALTPNLDAIDQFNLIDGPLNAEYDRNSGGIVSATIKQGSNHFHGDVFEFYRDTFLNTNNFFQKTYAQAVVNGVATGPFLRTDKVSAFHQHIFGATIGGPVFRDKLFFFGAYQGIRQRTPQGTYSSTVFSPGNLTGDFSADATAGAFSTNPIPTTISIPGCVAGQTWASCLNPKNGILPASSFNTLAAGLATKYVPAVNSGTNSFVYNSTTATTQNQYIGRLDYALNPKNNFTVLGIYQQQTSTSGIPFSGATVPGFGDGSISHIQQWTADYTRQVSSSAVNDLAAHYTRFNFKAAQPQVISQPSAAGFAITPQDTAGATLPSIGVAGFFTLGGTTNGPQPRIDQVIQLDDNFSKTFGHHNLKFGYDGRRFNVSNTFDASNSGAFGFNTTGAYSTGDASLDFLLGIPASYAQGTGAIIQADAYLNYVYAQDSWRATKTLTLDYGLGYSIDTPLRNHQYGGIGVACLIGGQQSTIFPGAPKSMNFPGDPGCSNAGQAYTRHNEFGPRVGFAWAPDLGWFSGTPGKFSIRGGFGIYYNRSEEESALQTLGTPPFGFTSNGAADVGGTASFANPFVDINGSKAASEANRFPYAQPVKGQAVDFAANNLLPIYNISSFDKSFRAPYSENFQVSMEREFPGKVVTRATYVGALGRHNQVDYEGNPETAAGQAACLASATCSSPGNRVLQQYFYPSHTQLNNPDFISIGEVGSYASSNYNSLQISLTKAPTHGLLLQASYTYAHAMDDASSFENAGFGEFGQRGYNQYQKSLNYGDSTFDARHHFVISPVYTTPILKGHSTFSPLNLALSGWEVSAIAQFSTGQPFDISYAGGSSNSLYCSIFISFYACPDVPQQIAPLVKADPRARLANGHGQYFQKASFAAEPVGSFGNVHRNPYHGPGVDNTNLVLAKNFNLSSDGVIRLQLRMESDNVFNHTQFNNPASTFSDSVPKSTTTSFGQITSAAAARQTLIAAKIYF